MEDPLVLAALCAAALAAGFVDAIAGGGGLVTVPALLAAGLPPHLALGTNKGQSVFGTLAAAVRYARAGHIDLRRAAPMAALGLAGSLLGALLQLALPPESLRPVVLVLLPAAAAVVLLGPRRREGAAGERGRGLLAAGTLGFLVAGYDGFFGPGTGTFLVLGFTGILGWSPVRATAEAKVVNAASNLAAMAVFALRGTVLWGVALPMAAAQVAGGLLGAHAAVRRGDGLVRGVLAVVVLGLVARLGWDLWRAGG